MITNTAFILLSLYSQMIFIINKQHHNIVFLPKHKGNALYIKKHIYAGLPGRDNPLPLCSQAPVLNYSMLSKYLNAEEAYFK